MKQITQKEFIKLIEEKQENAKNSLVALGREQTWTIKEGQINILKKETYKAYIDAYQDLICYLNGVKIVPEEITQEDTELLEELLGEQFAIWADSKTQKKENERETRGKYIDVLQKILRYTNCGVLSEHNDELDAQQYAVQNLVYFGEKVCVHTKKRIVGSRTPFTAIGKIGSDSGEYIGIQTEDGGRAIIDKKDIEIIEIVPDNKLLEPLCNKCSETKEGCPFHRMGSAYEECSSFQSFSEPEDKQEDLKEMLEKTPITPYIEPKVEPLRNDRFREFEIKENGRTRKDIVDATSIMFIRFYDNNGERFVIEIWSVCGYVSDKQFIEEPRAKAYYNELVEWWKYWKQN